MYKRRDQSFILFFVAYVNNKCKLRRCTYNRRTLSFILFFVLYANELVITIQINIYIRVRIDRVMKGAFRIITAVAYENKTNKIIITVYL